MAKVDELKFNLLTHMRCFPGSFNYFFFSKNDFVDNDIRATKKLLML